MSFKWTVAVLSCLFVLGCGGDGQRTDTGTPVTPPTPDWTITAASGKALLAKTTTNLGVLFDAGTVEPGQAGSAIQFQAVAQNGYSKSIQLGDVSSTAATHVTCVPSVNTILPTASGAPFTVGFTVPANFPYSGTGATFEGIDPSGNKKTVGITFKVRTVSGSASKGSFKSGDLTDSIPIAITPINGFTGTVGITFDKTIQSNDGVPNGYAALPAGITVSAKSISVAGTASANAAATFAWTNWAAGNYAVVAVLVNGTAAIRVPVEVTVTASTTGTTVTYGTPISVPSGIGATVRCVSPGGKMAGTDNSNNLLYWSSPTSSPTTVSSSGLGSEAGPIMIGINDSGQMVGNAAKGPCYWSSPTSNPVYLKLPAGYDGGTAYSINASGAIVGMVDSFGSLSNAMGVYWSSPTATPVLLSESVSGGSGNETLALGISNAGLIAGTTFVPSGGQRVMAWTSTTGAPTVFSPNASQSYAGMNQVTGAICGSSSNMPYVWSPGGFAAQQYAGTGIPEAVGTDGVLVGTNLAQSTATVWASPTAQPVALSTLVPSLTGWTLQQAQFVTSANDVIGIGLSGGSTGVFVVHRTK